jgi:hypothetical protein
MSHQEKELLLSEKSYLEEMLQTLPASHVIDRLSLEARIKKLEEELKSIKNSDSQPFSMNLIFQGKPVYGAHGILANFASETLKSFTDAVRTIAVSTISALGKRGPLPNRRKLNFLITGTLVGSFGFQLEEAFNQEELFPENSVTQQAMMKVFDLLKASVGTDDELTEVVADLDPRAVENVHGFLKTLADEEATCSLEFQGNLFSFQDLEQLRRSESRPRKDNIMEGTDNFTGEFLGFLPIKRLFEFRIKESVATSFRAS